MTARATRRSAAKPVEPLAFMFHDDGVVPNNPRLPLLYYRGAIDLSATPDPARVIETLFAMNGWGGMWRNGIYPLRALSFADPRSLGIARGGAKVRFGGDKGQELESRGRRGAAAGRHRASMPVGEPGPDGDRRLSVRRVLRSLPRQPGRACQGAAIDPESAAAEDPIRSMARSGPLLELWRK